MAIIKNYGFLWERDSIYRGAGSNAGHLKEKSKPEKSKPTQPEIDFKEQIGVYALYDSDRHIVYVGQAGNGKNSLFSRLKQHEDDHLWNRWKYFSWVGFRNVNKTGKLSQHQDASTKVNGFTYAKALNEIEGILIEIVEPKLNKQSGKLKNATEYFQVRDPKLNDIGNQVLLEEIKSLNKKLDQLGKEKVKKKAK